MTRKENSGDCSFIDDARVISSGIWNENTTWKFILDDEEPPRELCTAVCCILVENRKLLLVRNERGWEFPAGHIEENETLSDAMTREIYEETMRLILKPGRFGYKRITSRERVVRDSAKNIYYPFPHSYIVFYLAQADTVADSKTFDDVYEIGLFSLSEAKKIPHFVDKYSNIVEYLVNRKLINIVV